MRTFKTFALGLLSAAVALSFRCRISHWRDVPRLREGEPLGSCRVYVPLQLWCKSLSTSLLTFYSLRSMFLLICSLIDIANVMFPHLAMVVSVPPR